MDDKKYLSIADDMAKQSSEPLKCASILVGKDGDIIAQNYNSQRKDGIIANHAEMKSITEANRLLGRKLVGVTAYGNCEPCTMCLTAMIFAGVERIVFRYRLNDLIDDERTIDIDCFDFAKRFPYSPAIEQVQFYIE
jgi:guanine deaminase